MVVWRLLYLEKRRQRIMDSLASATRNEANTATKREILCIVIAVIAAIGTRRYYESRGFYRREYYLLRNLGKIKVEETNE